MTAQSKTKQSVGQQNRTVAEGVENERLNVAILECVPLYSVDIGRKERAKEFLERRMEVRLGKNISCVYPSIYYFSGAN